MRRVYMTTYTHWNVPPVFYETAWLWLWWPQDVIRTTGILSHSYKFGYIVRYCEATILYYTIPEPTQQLHIEILNPYVQTSKFDKLPCITSFLTCVYTVNKFSLKSYTARVHGMLLNISRQGRLLFAKTIDACLVHWLVNFALGVAPWLTLVQDSLAMKTDNFWRA
jgi:hypothetical protein